ncbi:Vegetative incompatibility protein HET-E-1 [Ceratocystis fimbriata CBS 114723]|uniref:Vegetative incompatibility protein HET-E-1 n=1 Tax=Ceratocystis fimbriata CBS 114723 TaxID=1035309 RepID=A0A2C5WDP9_9PEZI|nr:Vegetative incompatibility protein HET-E-1 [Ceratocystis fimbriata CBS 114723]
MLKHRNGLLDLPIITASLGSVGTSQLEVDEIRRILAKWEGGTECLSLDKPVGRVHWVPGHCEVPGNEAVDQLAKAGCKSSDLLVPEKTMSLAAARRWKNDAFRADFKDWMRDNCPNTDHLGGALGIPRPYKLDWMRGLNRGTVARILAARSKHGDFEEYHTRFNHQDAETKCQVPNCGKPKDFCHPWECIGNGTRLAGSLLLDENKKNTAATVLRDALEESITQLFQQLLSYQIRSICLYRRNKVVGFIRDVFLIDDWAGQVNGIKEAEKAVQHDIEQYNTQESQQQMQKLNDSTAAMQANVANIHTAVQSLAEQQAKAREDDKNNECLRELYVTDPRIDKEIIENRKGGLLKDSYKWILEHQGFKKFKNEADSRILWIKGDPGKGKIMLLCGIINELESDHSTSPYYFFCQDTGGSRLNTATSVLRGLVYHLTKLNPQLIEHVRKGYDPTAKKQFENEGAWYHISKIATAMLEDPSLKNAVLIVDALDECVVDQGLLLDFIKTSSAKWIVSSRNRPEIEQSLNDATQRVKIHLEINEDSVSMAVNFFIKYKVNQLVQKKGYGDEVKEAVLEYLQSNSHGTFLWVALVCQELLSSKTRRWETLAKLKSFPPGLDALYGQMLKEISESPHAQLYKEVIAKVLVVYRPITLEELRAMVEALKDFNIKDIEEVVAS